MIFHFSLYGCRTISLRLIVKVDANLMQLNLIWIQPPNNSRDEKQNTRGKLIFLLADHFGTEQLAYRRIKSNQVALFNGVARGQLLFCWYGTITTQMYLESNRWSLSIFLLASYSAVSWSEMLSLEWAPHRRDANLIHLGAGRKLDGDHTQQRNACSTHTHTDTEAQPNWNCSEANQIKREI